MKKHLAIFFTVFYFGFSSGMVFNVHYCLDQIFISNSSSNSCNLCGTDKKKDCCKSETKVLKTDVAQKADISVVSQAPIAALVEQSFNAEFLKPIVERNYFAIYSNAPPGRSKIPLFISNCNFRI